MPELPEVETVRRGLEPVMEGARFVRVELRRPDLRFPFPQNFNKRLEGQSVVGLGRRAKYLLADLTSGEVRDRVREAVDELDHIVTDIRSAVFPAAAPS